MLSLLIIGIKVSCLYYRTFPEKRLQEMINACVASMSFTRSSIDKLTRDIDSFGSTSNNSSKVILK